MNLGIHKKGIIVILTILLSFCACFNAFAQDDTWFYDKPISKIVFDGLVHVNREEVTAVTNQYLGKDFTDMLYSELISKIYALELFEEIIPEAIPADETKRSVVLKFTVKELPVITDIEFKGNAHIKPTALKEVIGVKELEVLNEQKIPADVRAITEHYLNKGYTNVKVSYNLEKKDDGDVILTFNISEGKSVIVTEINFEGNYIVSEKTLKGKFTQKEKGIFNKGAFLEANEELDRQAILNYYHSRGYIDATVIDIKRTITTNLEENRDEMVLTYVLREGEQYTYGGITIIGNTIFSTEQLEDCIKLKPGMIFNQPKFNEGLTAIYDTYFESGYTYNSFDDRMNRDTEKHEVSFTLRIIENDRAHIENIIIKGNEKTKDYVILRELPLESGDIFSKSKLTSGLRNLYNLQFFSMVAPQILPGSENNLVDLIINVEEQSTTSLEFGLTFSGVTETNKIPVSIFAKWQDSNVAGTGKTLSAQLSVATDQQSVSLGYNDSWFLGLPLSFSLSGSFYHKELTTLQNMYLPDGLNTTEYYMDYTNWTTSLSASLGRRWTPDFAILTLAGGISFNLLNNVYDPEMYTPVDTTISEYNNDWGWTNAIWASFSVDDRNINYDPTKGWFASQRLSWTGLIPAIEDQFYLRSDTKLEGYLPLVDWEVSEHWSLQLILAGYTGFSFQIPSANTTIGATNQLYIDGMFNGRGWSTASNVKGQAMWSSYVELRWPFVKGMLAADFFFDTVALKDTVQDLANLSLNDFRFSFGPGLRIAMPQFPLRFLLANTFYFKDGQFTWREDNKADWQFVLSFNIINK